MSPTGTRLRPAAGFCLSSLLLACTPYGSDLDDTLVGPDDDSGEDQGAELEEAELESIYDPRPDDDRLQPTAELDDELRCFERTRIDQAWELQDPNGEPETGILSVARNGKVLALPLQETKFDTVVVGTVAETEVVQVFANPFDEVIEAVYLFPLHERAAVDDYWLTIGERTIRGQIERREDARKHYEEAKREGQTAALLEQERPNVFTQNVANIPPGGVIEVSLHVVQPLEQDHGRYALVLPTVVGPRFIPGAPTGHQGHGPTPDTDRVPDGSRVTAPILPEGYTACADIEVSVALESGLRPRQLRSAHHDIDIRREGDVAFVDLDHDRGPVVANRDFILSWELGADTPTAAIVAQPERGSGGGYFTLTVQPPKLVPDDQVTARELVFVVDTSGSMGGEPIDTAKQLMRHSLAGLRSDDMFNVLNFADSASGLSSTLLPANAHNINIGLDYIDAMAGGGGTDMRSGIAAALDMPRERDRMRMVLFLTDGYIGNEAEIFSLIEQRIGDARLFSLGVGAGPNRYLLDGMAHVGRGAVTYAEDQGSVDEVIDHFYERIATPVLTDIEIDWQGMAVDEILPGHIPDLFAGQPLTVFGRYSGTPSGDIVVRGKVRGSSVEIPVAIDIATAKQLDGVSSVWARTKVDELLGYPLTTSPHAVADSTRDAVIELALQHRIMTDYTSFVAIDERRVVEPDGTIRTVVQPLPIPAGTTYEGFVGEGIGVGGIGLIGKGGGGGSGYGYGSSSGSGYGRGSGGGFGGRGARVPQVRQAKAVVTGSLDKDIIRRIVRAHINEVRNCYNAALIRNPSVAGRVTLDMTIVASGKVSTALVHANDTGDEELGKCIAKASKSWQFPKLPGDGGSVSVRYPFELQPG